MKFFRGYTTAKNTYFSESKPKQDWAIGNIVKVGFLNLEVVGIKTNTTYRGHQIFELKNAKGVRFEFSAYEGLNRVDQ